MSAPTLDARFYMQSSFNQCMAYTAWLRSQQKKKNERSPMNRYLVNSYYQSIADLERASWMHLFIHEERTQS